MDTNNKNKDLESLSAESLKLIRDFCKKLALVIANNLLDIELNKDEIHKRGVIILDMVRALHNYVDKRLKEINNPVESKETNGK